MGAAPLTDVETLLAQERALRASSHDPAVRDEVVAALDRAQLHGLAAAWDVDPPAGLSARRVLARIARFTELGAPELAVALATATRALAPRPARHLRERAAADLQERRALLDANLEALRDRAPDTAAAIAESTRAFVALSPAGSGVVRLTDDEAPLELAVATPTHAAALESARAVVQRLRQVPGDVVLGGVGNGSLLTALVATPARIAVGLGRTFLVRLVELDPSRLRALLEVLDVRAALRAGWLVPTVGPDACETLADHLRRPFARPDAHVVVDQVYGGAGVQAGIAAALERARAWQEGRLARARDRAHARAGVLAARWSAAHEGDQKLRLLLVSSRTTSFLRVAIANLATAARALGHEAAILEEPDELGNVCPADLAEAVETTAADAVLAIDWVRATTGAVPSPVPFVTWELDWLQHTLQARAADPQALGPHDHMWIAAPESAIASGWSLERVYPFPTPPSAAILEHARSISSRPVRIADAGYIANLHVLPEQALAALRAQASREPGDGARHLDRAWELVAGTAGGLPPSPADLATIFEDDAPAEHRDGLTRLRLLFQHEVVGPVYRLGRLERLVSAGADLAIWGTGWQNHPRLGRFSRGPLSGPEDLVRGIRSTAVQLQVLFGSALHPRLVDAAAIGACVLVQRHPHDFVGRVRRASTGAEVIRPSGMRDDEWSYLSRTLVSNGAHEGATPNERARRGLALSGIALDEILPEPLLEVVALADAEALVLTIRRLADDDDEREALGRALQASVLEHLDPVRQLDRALRSVAAREKGTNAAHDRAA